MAFAVIALGFSGKRSGGIPGRFLIVQIVKFMVSFPYEF
jgi:hypothetical protein